MRTIWLQLVLRPSPSEGLVATCSLAIPRMAVETSEGAGAGWGGEEGL